MKIAVWVLTLDLLGVFAFAAGGAFSAIRAARIDIVGVFTLGIISAIGGGIMRDLLLGEAPPAALSTWYYPVVAIVGSSVPLLIRRPGRWMKRAILLLDGVGLSLVCVSGAQKALDHGVPPGTAIGLGVITAVGGGAMRDLMVRRVPLILYGDFYLIPALVGASLVVIGSTSDQPSPMPILAGLVAFGLRMLGVWRKYEAPKVRSAEAQQPDEVVVMPPDNPDELLVVRRDAEGRLEIVRTAEPSPASPDSAPETGAPRP